MERKKIKKSFWIKLVSVPVLMFFVAYAMVPIYDVLCDITGFNGKTGTVETEQEYVIDEELSLIHIVSVRRRRTDRARCGG